jgi:hypothetical protein
MRAKPIKRIGLSAGIFLAALVFYLCIHLKQPAYGGYPLEYWFNKLSPTIVSAGSIMTADQMSMGGRTYGSQRESQNTSRSAIQNISTNGLPFLMQKLAKHEAPLANLVQLWLSKCGVRRSLFPSAEIERGQAVTALLALSPLSPETISKLRILSKESGTSVGQSAAYLLRASTNTSFKPATAPNQ